MKPTGTDEDNSKLVQELNRLMAEEVEAFLRYLYLEYRVCGTDRLIAEKFFGAAKQETIEHAQEIAKKIRLLGHTPKLEINLSLDGGHITLREALAEALEFEQQALDAYQEFLPVVDGDTTLEDFIRRQVATETEHVKEIALLLD